MKIIFYFFLVSLAAPNLFAKVYSLTKSSASYTVKHLVKTVKGESRELKGKLLCENENCEFLVAVPSASFISSDSNRDLNMQTILDVMKYPLITVKGTFPEANLSKTNFDIKSLVSFHGVVKEYVLNIQNGMSSSGSFTLLLEDHKVERPSLLMAKINNEVPISFTFFFFY